MKRIFIIGIVFLGVQIFLIIIFFSISIFTNSKKNLHANITSSNSKEKELGLLETLTLEQKVGQLIHIGMTGKVAHDNSPVVKNIKKYYAGGVIQFAINYKSAKETLKLNKALQKVAMQSHGIPLFISTDQEGGRVYRVGPDGTTQFPGAMALGQTGNTSLAHDVGFVTGYELGLLGINMIFAPVLDINNNPDNPVIQTRSFGSNLQTVSTLGVNFMKGMSQSNSTPVIKHFPGHGDTNVDSHLALPIIRKNLSSLRSLELIPFQKAINNGSQALMSAHILFPSLDNKNPATLSPRILKGLLRNKMGYKGLIISDAIEMKAIANRYGQGEAAVLAFEAGVDVILLTSEGKIIKNIYKALLTGFQSGRLQESDLDEAIKRQISLKRKKHLFQKWSLKEGKNYYGNTVFKNLQSQYKNITKKYKQQKSLNQVVSRKSIRSLRKDFNTINVNSNIIFYYRSKVMAQEARHLGIKPQNIRYLKNKKALYSILKSKKIKQTYVIELLQSHISTFNKIIKTLNARNTNKTNVVALYAHNPFVRLRVPAKGAVLASFSPTTESKKALLFNLIARKKIKKADLILSSPLP